MNPAAEHAYVVGELRRLRSTLDAHAPLDVLDEDGRRQAVALGARIDALLMASETPDPDDLTRKLATLIVRTGVEPSALFASTS